ncbi:hypothetical protein [Uliginosibacterium gangwonense]|uniref:hypothetical protein n=1 Tax=Uliginosibacterium gangwonense TaxID=392736 RepID=UPI000373C195|nr:hypothetical protein [Uliginosibacterium gangwonense]
MRRVFDIGTTVLILLILVWGMWQAQRVMRGDFAGMQARYRIDTWIAGKARWSVEQWLQARDDLAGAARITPDNPLVFDYLGMLYTLRGQRAWQNDVLRQAFFADALRFQQDSLRLRPHNGAAWANLALSQYALGTHGDSIASINHAMQEGPNEIRVRQVVTELIIAMWSESPEHLHVWLRERYRVAAPWEHQELERLAVRYERRDLFK